MPKLEQHEYIKLSLKEFLNTLKSLLSSNVEVFNSYSGKEEVVVSVCPKELTYTLSSSGTLPLSHKLWDDVDYMRFRHSFKFKDGFTV